MKKEAEITIHITRRLFNVAAFGRSVGAVGLAGGLIVWIGSLAAQSPAAQSDADSWQVELRRPRVVVVKSTRLLHLFEGEALVRTFPVVLGSHPDGNKRRAGDGRTPEGIFRICSKNANSPHFRFLGINYPDREAADRGVEAGLLSTGEATAIYQAHDIGDCPSWTTALGGGIGLHGAADREPQTAGCIALRDEHVAELFDVLRIGDEVEILP